MHLCAASLSVLFFARWAICISSVKNVPSLTDIGLYAYIMLLFFLFNDLLGNFIVMREYISWFAGEKIGALNV